MTEWGRGGELAVKSRGVNIVDMFSLTGGFVLFLSHVRSPAVVKSPLDKPFILHTAAETIVGLTTEKNLVISKY